MTENSTFTFMVGVIDHFEVLLLDPVMDLITLCSAIYILCDLLIFDLGKCPHALDHLAAYTACVADN